MQSVIGLLIMAAIAVSLVIALQTAQDGRIWLLAGACVAGACALYICVVLLARVLGGGGSTPTRGWRSRGPWPEGPGLPEHRSPTSHLLGAMLGLGVLGLGLLGQGVVVIARGTWDGALLLGIFGALSTGGACLAGYLLAQALRYRPAHLRLQTGDWPLATGAEHHLEVSGPVIALPGSDGLHVQLMLLQERMVRRVTNHHLRWSVQVDRLAIVPVGLTLRLPPNHGLDARLSFRLPADPVLAPAERLTGSGSAGARVANRRADGSYAMAVPGAPPQLVPVDTDLAADEPRYWLLVMRAEVAGVDWYAEWLLPVEAPVARQDAPSP